MAQFPNIFNCDLHSGPVSASIRQMYLGDIAANRVGVRVTDNGEAVALSGTCSGTAMLYNGGTVALTGVVDGNLAYVDLPAAVYSVEGPLQIFVTLTQGGSTTTLLEMRSNVTRTETGVVIDPGTIISSVAALISDIEDAVESIPEDYSELSADVVQLKADMEDVQPAVETLEDDVSSLKSAIGETPMGTTATTVTGAIAEHQGEIETNTAAIGAETTRATTAEALKVNKPTSSPNGTSGQLLRTNGDGTTQWVDQGLPTDEQTSDAVSAWLDDHPEATTTVEDGSITIPKLAETTKDMIVIQETTEKAYYHDVAPTTAMFYPNSYTQDIPIRYAKCENLFNYNYLSGDADGVTRTPNGRFLELSGKSTGGMAVSTMSGQTAALAKLAGKTVNVCFYINKQSAWAGNGNLYLKVNNTTVVNQYLKPDGVSFNGFAVYNNITMPGTMTNLVFQFAYINNSEFEDGDFFWAGIFETTPVETGSMVTTDPVELSISNATKIDSMMHESIVTAIIPTKQYVDNHIPDIKSYWTDEIYALPEKFGAVGDGVTDDTQAIADCVAYASTSGKPVRGFGKYKTSSTITLGAQNLDVYFREIDCIGNYPAISIENTRITLEFHRIESAGIGISFAGTSTRAHRCQIKGNEINSISHCIEINDRTYYNTVDIRNLATASGDCIHYTNNDTGVPGEYVFRSASCACPNGYVSYGLVSSKFYDFTIEGNCKYGLLNPVGCVCVGFRHREQVDGMFLRIYRENENYNNGALIIFTVHPESKGFKYISGDPLPWYAIDVSAINGYSTIPSGVGSTENWQKLTYNGVDLGTPICGKEDTSRQILGEMLYIIGGNIVLATNKRQTVIVNSATYDYRVFEVIDKENIGAAIGMKFGTDFIVDVEHSDIYFNASFGAVGYNTLTLTQANGKSATIYDKLGNVLFDGTEEGDGKWSLKCVADMSSFGRYQSTTNWWLYDGTNETWEIEKIG